MLVDTLNRGGDVILVPTLNSILPYLTSPVKATDQEEVGCKLFWTCEAEGRMLLEHMEKVWGEEMAWVAAC